MTFEVDNEALKRAMVRHYEEKLSRELREMFIFTQNPDMAEIWKLYMEEIRKKQLRQASHEDGAKVLFTIAMTGMVIWGLWKVFSFTPT